MTIGNLFEHWGDWKEWILQRCKKFDVKNSKHVSVAFLVGIAMVMGTYGMIGVVGWAKKSYLLNRSDRVVAVNKQREREEFKKLVEEQAARSETKTQSEDSRKRASGKWTINFVLVKPSGLNEFMINPIIDKIESFDGTIYQDCGPVKCVKNASLKYLETFYKQQADRYGVTGFEPEVKFWGVYSLPEVEKVGDIAYMWGKDPFAAVKLQDDFARVLTTNNINFGERDLVVFLYFDNSFGGAEAGGEDRFYEHKKFRSFADEGEGRVYINVYRFDPAFSRQLTEIAIHEVLHLYGASDKYEESESVTRVCSQKGRGDTEKEPALPQTTADVMCMYIELSGEEFKRGSITENSLVINQETAKEIGWR